MLPAEAKEEAEGCLWKDESNLNNFPNANLKNWEKTSRKNNKQKNVILTMKTMKRFPVKKYMLDTSWDQEK